MATIEINLETYNALLEEKKRLEKINCDLQTEIKEKENIIDKLEESLDILESTPWFERLFRWKYIIKLANDD